MPRVLLVDDDVELCNLLAEYLRNAGLAVTIRHDGEAALRACLEDPADLMLLDVSMGATSGFDVLRKLRLFSVLPVLMLTARDEDADRIAGLEAGADDYLTKPFNSRELLARIQAILRRTRPSGGLATEKLSVGLLGMNLGTGQVAVAGVPVTLTEVEQRVLEVLARHAGRAVSRAELTQQGLGRRFSGMERSIDTHVSTLRRKLGAEFERTTPIVSVRGTGYMLRLPA